MDDARHMTRAVALAAAGTGATYPNPSVGAVIVRDGEIVGEGRTAATGGPHAEIAALADAGARAVGATLYVTLEPCSHVGRTGPCTEAVIAAGVRRVVVGTADPAPHAAGRGLRRLAEAGIEVVLGVEGPACEQVHEHYLHHVRTARPFVSLKVATSLDGCIATHTRDSKWITGEDARRDAHRLRTVHHGIAVGVDTLLHDDPRLDVRLVEGVSPRPIVFDSQLRSGASPSSQLWQRTPLVLHTAAASPDAKRRVVALGAEVVEVGADGEGRVDVVDALRELGRRELRSLLVEGGGRLLGSFVAREAWNRLYIYRAPLLLGDGTRAFGGFAPAFVRDGVRLIEESHVRLGDDWLSVWRPAQR